MANKKDLDNYTTISDELGQAYEAKGKQIKSRNLYGVYAGFLEGVAIAAVLFLPRLAEAAGGDASVMKSWRWLSGGFISLIGLAGGYVAKSQHKNAQNTQEFMDKEFTNFVKSNQEKIRETFRTENISETGIDISDINVRKISDALIQLEKTGAVASDKETVAAFAQFVKQSHAAKVA